MTPIFSDSFKFTENNAYPDGWLCEQNCELPYKLATVLDDEFCITGRGNKHLPLIPPGRDFELDFNVRGDRFYGIMGLEIYFHYNIETREGWVLRFDWGVCGGKTNRWQNGMDKYICELFRYRGRKVFGKYESVFHKIAPGYLKDLSRRQKFNIKCNGDTLIFTHSDSDPFFISFPSGFSNGSFIALDQSHSHEIWHMDKKGAHRISSFSIRTSSEQTVKTTRQETKTEFPSDINGIISPYYFHIAAMEKDGLAVLRAKLTGGPSKEALYPDIDRCRFGEKMHNPYVRIEDASGKDMGKFIIAKGSVGLTDFNWNIKATVMYPADFECPLERDIILQTLPDDARIYIGYELYESEDSISLSGGPSEALIDSDGKVVFSGKCLLKGEARFSISSPENKRICAEIPKDIPFYEDALAFAKKNHFFKADEKIRFCIDLYSRDENISEDSIKAKIEVKDVFGARISDIVKISFKNSKPLPGIKNAAIISTEYFELPNLKTGVYHICAKISGAALPLQRVTFEVMPENPENLPAPLASGLPRLYPNILSGIKGEHFHPWSRAVSDVCHYHCAGNNYYKVAREWKAPELVHVYRREWLCWTWKNVYDEFGIEANEDLIEKADASTNDLPRHDLWTPKHYCKAFVFETLLKFLQSDKFEPVENGTLSYDQVASRSKDNGISREQFLELFKNNWKKWLMFFTSKNMELLKEKTRKISQINPGCKTFMFAPFYPTYVSSYKSGYFPLLFGMDPRNGLEEILPGPNGFEDYPYSSGYSIARGTYQLASCKMESPGTKLYPEVFGINGETLDPRVVFANPPLGQSDPPPGFLLKQFYEYSYAATWFDKSGFNFWNDHGYYPKTWDRENYDEMLEAYSFISKTVPSKPLRTSAFAFSRDACLAHPDYYETDDDLFFNGSVVNTAEESVAYAYEQAREAGLPAGFTVKLEDIAGLSPEDVDILFIPPLCGGGDEIKHEIRRLQKEGVALFGFEDASGLEDIFGIESAGEEVKAGKIVPGRHLSAKALDGMSEKTNHELCVIRHKLAGAETLLQTENGSPVLTICGKTAFFTLPPTFVNRAATMTPTWGQQAKSEMINAATRLAISLIGNPEVESSAGTLIAFHDQHGNAHIIASEDSCPRKGKSIRPLVRINIPDIESSNVSSDKDFELIDINAERVILRLHLNPYETAKIKIKA